MRICTENQPLHSLKIDSFPDTVLCLFSWGIFRCLLKRGEQRWTDVEKARQTDKWIKRRSTSAPAGAEWVWERELRSHPGQLYTPELPAFSALFSTTLPDKDGGGCCLFAVFHGSAKERERELVTLSVTCWDLALTIVRDVLLLESQYSGMTCPHNTHRNPPQHVDPKRSTTNTSAKCNVHHFLKFPPGLLLGRVPYNSCCTQQTDAQTARGILVDGGFFFFFILSGPSSLYLHGKECLFWCVLCVHYIIMSTCHHCIVVRVC